MLFIRAISEGVRTAGSHCFDDTYAVFGGNRAVAGKDVAIDCAVDVVFVTVNFIAEDFGRKSIVVQAAVAQMSEADDLYAFEILFQIFGAPADKVGNAPDRNGNIVFDAGAQFALGGGDVFAQRPHMDTFLFALRQYAVGKSFYKEIRQADHQDCCRVMSRSTQVKYAILNVSAGEFAEFGRQLGGKTVDQFKTA